MPMTSYGVSENPLASWSGDRVVFRMAPVPVVCKIIIHAADALGIDTGNRGSESSRTSHTTCHQKDIVTAVMGRAM